MKRKILSGYEYYKGDARSIAHGIKEGNPAAIDKAARDMSRLLPRGATIVPIPNRSGRAVVTLTLADAIRSYRPDVNVADALEGTPRTQSFYDRKVSGERVSTDDLGYKVRSGVHIGNKSNTFLIDNVLDTGTTFNAAAKALGVKNLIVYASPNKRIRSSYDADGNLKPKGRENGLSAG